MKKGILYIALIAFTILSCSIFKGKDKRKNEIVLFRISGSPIRALDYKRHKKYIDDYEILASHHLSDSDTVKLTKILSSDSLLIKGNNHRSCEFFPAYALKWSSGKIILISLSPCSKIQVIKKAADSLVVNDLRDHNDLENWLIKRDTTPSK